MYRVHVAADPGRVVALKVLDDHHRREDQTARLRREFEFAHQIDHPNVITVYRHGPGWLTMELVEGGTAAVLPDEAGQAGSTGADRRRAGPHPSVRHCALRRQADQYPCLAGLFTRCAHRLRCGVCGLRDGRLACDAHRGLAAVHGAGAAARQAAVGAHRSVRVGVHGRRTAARRATVLRAETWMELVDAHLNRPVPSYSRKIAGVPRLFDSVTAPGIGQDPG